MNKTNFEKIGDVTYPVVYLDNGMVIIDYPIYNPDVAKKITEEGQKRIKEISKIFKEHGL